MRTSLWEGGRRCQEVAGREGVIIIFERWGWVLVFSLWGSSPPTFLIFFGLSQKWVTFFDFSLKLHCYIAYKLVFVRIIRVRKGGKSQNEFLFSDLEGVRGRVFVYCLCLSGWVRIVLKMFFFGGNIAYTFGELFLGQGLRCLDGGRCSLSFFQIPMFVLVQFFIDQVWDVGKGGEKVWGQRCWQNIMGHGGDGTWSSRLKVEPLKSRFFFYLLLSSSYFCYLLSSSFFFFPNSSFFCLHLSASFVFPSLFVFPFSSSFVLFILFFSFYYYTYLALTLSLTVTPNITLNIAPIP